LHGNANSLDLVHWHEFEEGKFVFAGNANHFLDREIGGKREWYLALQVLVRRHDEEFELELEGYLVQELVRELEGGKRELYLGQELVRWREFEE
jgi:hypothetical protein